MFYLKKYSTKFYLLIFLLYLQFDHNFLNLTYTNDEFTFLLIGKSIFNGYPPFVEHWDLRGPLGFYFYALPFFFDNYLIVAKLLGLVSIYITGLICFFISKKHYNIYAGIFSSFGLILYISSSKHFFALHIEIFLLPIISGFIYFFLEFICNKRKIDIFYMAVLISMATLMRPNLCILALISFFFILKNKKDRFNNSLTYIISGLIPLVLILIPYLNINGGLQIFLNSTLHTHLSHIAGRPFYLGFYKFFEILTRYHWAIIFFVLPLIVFFSKKEIFTKNLYLFFLLIGSIFSIAVSGKFSEHHFLMFIPFAIIICSSIFQFENLKDKKTIIVVFFLFFVGSLLSNSVAKINIHFKPANGKFEIYNFMKYHIDEEDKIFSTDISQYLFFNKKNYFKTVGPCLFDRDYNLSKYYGKEVKFTNIFQEFLKREKPKYLIFRRGGCVSSKLYKKLYEILKKNYSIYEFYKDEQIINLKRSTQKEIKNYIILKLNN